MTTAVPIRQQLVQLLTDSQAHMTFEQAVADYTASQTTVVEPGHAKTYPPSSSFD
jgi:hypothetical protein